MNLQFDVINLAAEKTYSNLGKDIYYLSLYLFFKLICQYIPVDNTSKELLSTIQLKQGCILCNFKDFSPIASPGEAKIGGGGRLIQLSVGQMIGRIKKVWWEREGEARRGKKRERKSEQRRYEGMGSGGKDEDGKGVKGGKE